MIKSVSLLITAIFTLSCNLSFAEINPLHVAEESSSRQVVYSGTNEDVAAKQNELLNMMQGNSPDGTGDQTDINGTGDQMDGDVTGDQMDAQMGNMGKMAREAARIKILEDKIKNVILEQETHKSLLDTAATYLEDTGAILLNSKNERSKLTMPSPVPTKLQQILNEISKIFDDNGMIGPGFSPGDGYALAAKQALEAYEARRDKIDKDYITNVESLGEEKALQRKLTALTKSKLSGDLLKASNKAQQNMTNINTRLENWLKKWDAFKMNFDEADGPKPDAVTYMKGLSTAFEEIRIHIPH